MVLFGGEIFEGLRYCTGVAFHKRFSVVL